MGVRIILLKDAKLELCQYGWASIDREGHGHINEEEEKRVIERGEGKGFFVQSPPLYQEIRNHFKSVNC